MALAHPAWIKRFLLLVLLRAEVASGFGKPVVPINVGNTSTNMGNSPSPALRAAQAAGEPFLQFLPSPEDGPNQQQPPTHPSPLLWSARPLWDSSAGFIRHLIGLAHLFLLINQNQSEWGYSITCTTANTAGKALTAHCECSRERQALTTLKTISLLTHN